MPITGQAGTRRWQPGLSYSVGFAATPYVAYTTKYAPDLKGPWQRPSNLTADPASLIGMEDLTTPAAPTRFYRAVYP